MTLLSDDADRFARAEDALGGAFDIVESPADVAALGDIVLDRVS
jgi:hypothetical protein